MQRIDNFKKLLEQNNIKYQQNFNLIDEHFDFYLDHSNTLIDIAITALYNSVFVPLVEVKPKYYFRDKYRMLSETSYRYIVIYDWDNLDKIVASLLNKVTLRASACEIKEVNKAETDSFLSLHHLQGKCRNTQIALGLYYNNELLQIMTFGKPRYNSRYQHELLRLCTKNGYIVYGGANKLFNYFIDNYKPDSIISYCDLSKFSGKVYNKLGFSNIATSSSKHWYNIAEGKYITDNLLRQQGADRILGTRFGKGTSNEEICLGAGYLPINDVGQATYVYKFSA